MVVINVLHLVFSKIKAVSHGSFVDVENVVALNSLERKIQFKIFKGSPGIQIVNKVRIWITNDCSVGVSNPRFSIEVLIHNGSICIQTIFKEAVENTHRKAFPDKVYRNGKW